MSDHERRGILFVCTGNICRSPYLEYALRSALSKGVAETIPVWSAGTSAPDGEQAAPEILDALFARGIDASRFRSRRLTRTDVAAAAIVITATRAHRADVVRLDARADDRTFTLFQLTRLLSTHAEARPSSISSLVASALAARGRSRGGEADDIDDPWQRPRRVYRRVISRMDTGIDSLAVYLPTTP